MKVDVITMVMTKGDIGGIINHAGLMHRGIIRTRDDTVHEVLSDRESEGLVIIIDSIENQCDNVS
jgi:hypothetical protein